MLMLSGPMELFVLLDLMASKTCMENIVMLDGWRFFVCLSMSLFSCEVEYFVACTNCLLKAVAELESCLKESIWCSRVCVCCVCDPSSHSVSLSRCVICVVIFSW